MYVMRNYFFVSLIWCFLVFFIIGSFLHFFPYLFFFISKSVLFLLYLNLWKIYLFKVAVLHCVILSWRIKKFKLKNDTVWCFIFITSYMKRNIILFAFLFLDSLFYEQEILCLKIKFFYKLFFNISNFCWVFVYWISVSD